MKTKNKFLLFITSITFVIFIACIEFSQSSYKLNVTSSLPLGLYKLKTANKLNKGDIIYFCLKGYWLDFAISKKYLTQGACPKGVAAIGKRIIATKDDFVKINEKGIYVNNIYQENTKPLVLDKKLNLKTIIDRKLKDNEIIVASNKDNSFDSRYFGIVDTKDVEGVLLKIF